MKFALAAALAVALATPAFAQESEAVLLIRVHIDAPYFYDILAVISDNADPRAHELTLLVEGKEVGETRLVYDCETGDYSEKMVVEWSGHAGLFMQPALIAYHDLFC